MNGIDDITAKPTWADVAILAALHVSSCAAYNSHIRFAIGHDFLITAKGIPHGIATFVRHLRATMPRYGNGTDEEA